MGILITTDSKPVKVWRSDKFGFPTYTITISKKEGDHYIREYQDIKFRQGVEVENGAEIYIQKAFPTVASWVKDEKQYTKKVWQILSFTYEPVTIADEVPGWEDIP